MGKQLKIVVAVLLCALLVFLALDLFFEDAGITTLRALADFIDWLSFWS
ncbi:MAG: hypothetical protein AAF771_04510 [Pseudomonadota bacterium]